MPTDLIIDMGTLPGFFDKETTQITWTIQENGSGLVPDNLWVTITDEDTGSVVNSRNREQLTPVTNYVSPTGKLTFNLEAGDNTLLNTKLQRRPEYRRVLFEFDWLSTTRRGFLSGRWKISPPEIPV